MHAHSAQLARHHARPLPPPAASRSAALRGGHRRRPPLRGDAAVKAAQHEKQQVQRVQAQQQAQQQQQQQQQPAAGDTAPSWRVWHGRMPLVGMERAAAALRGTPLGGLLQLHTYALLEGPGEVWYTDFLPLRPTSPATALLLLTGGTAPGEVRLRRLEGRAVKPGDGVRLVGACELPDPLAAARGFNRQYALGLHLLLNNCTHHTAGLTLALLPGEHEPRAAPVRRAPARPPTCAHSEAGGTWLDPDAAAGGAGERRAAAREDL